MLPNAEVFYIIHFHTTYYHIKKCVNILGGRTYPVRYYPIALRLRDIAFGNEIARMISLCSIIESNSYLRSPHSLTKLVGAKKNISRLSMHYA